MALDHLQTLKELCALSGVSGSEKPVRDYILSKIEAHVDEVSVDRMGNLIAVKKPRGGAAEAGRRVLLAAHMDEVGLIVSGIGENGLLSYLPVGGIDPRVMVSKRVVSCPDAPDGKAIPGVIGAKAIHLQSPEERTRMLSHDDLYIDIGAKNKADAEKLVSPGDVFAFVCELIEFGEGFLRGKALDDRVGCLNMMRLLTEDHPVELVCAFTVQEEVGLYGAKAYANAHDCACAVVLETTAVNDLGDVDAHLRVAELGKGATISFMDNRSIAHPGLAQALQSCADERGIAWQVKRFVSGGNDAGALQRARSGMPVAVLSVPCRYIHSHSSVANLGDIESQYLLAAAFIDSGAKFSL